MAKIHAAATVQWRRFLHSRLLRNRMDAAKQELEERGVAVVPGVISITDCDSYIAEYRQWLEKFGPSFPENFISIIHKYRIGHFNANWQIRLKVKPAFAQLWGTDKLHTSFDGLSIGPPPEQYPIVSNFANPENDKAKLHHDQCPQKKGLHVYQGSVYLEEATDADWCFKVMEGSHKYHSTFFRDIKWSQETEYRELSEEEVNWFEEKGCKLKRISVPKGGLVLWDSRTIHAGAPPRKGREASDRWRFVVFVCMGPAIWSTPKDMEVKKFAYKNLRISRHWPCHGFEMFKYVPTEPHLRHVDLQQLPEIAKCDDARLLAGDLMYDFNDGLPNGPPKPEWDT